MITTEQMTTNEAIRHLQKQEYCLDIIIKALKTKNDLIHRQSKEIMELEKKVESLEDYKFRYESASK